MGADMDGVHGEVDSIFSGTLTNVKAAREVLAGDEHELRIL